MIRTDIYSEVIPAGVTDSKGRHIAFQFSVWDADGAIYGRVQKGTLKNGEFKMFGATQQGNKYASEKQAITTARNIAKTRIAKLKAAQ